jgi:hypothetical protein
MRFEIVGSGFVACARACGLVMALAATSVAHEGHVVGSGFAAGMLHALEHGLGALAVAVAGVALAWRLRPTERRARRLVRHRDFS